MKKLVFLSMSFGAFFSFAQNTNTLLPFGNVGVGTLLPTAKLEVKGSTLLQGLTATGNTLLSNTKITGTVEVPGMQLTSSAILDLQFVLRDPVTGVLKSASLGQVLGGVYGPPPVSCGPAVLLAPTWSNGPSKIYSECPGVKVGIGTPVPEFTLHVNGTSRFESSMEVAGTFLSMNAATFNGPVRINNRIGVNTDPNTFSYFLIKNTTGYASIQVDHRSLTSDFSKFLYFQPNNGTAEILHVQNAQNKSTHIISADGSMIINNGEIDILRLSTSGTLKTRRITVDSQTWADYVFEPTYKLMPISDLRTYVATYKHLPNIPSTSEVTEQGLDIAEMNRLLLEKVEELTLYLLDQSEETQKLKAEVKELQKQIEALNATKN